MHFISRVAGLSLIMLISDQARGLSRLLGVFVMQKYFRLFYIAKSIGGSWRGDWWGIPPL